MAEFQQGKYEEDEFLKSTIEHTESSVLILSFDEKVRAYFHLLKFRLSFTVVFSSGMSYLLGSPKGVFNWGSFLIFCLGGFLATGAANIVNQVIEVEYDKLMSRTKTRPLPSRKLTKIQAIQFAVIIGIIGHLLLLHFIGVQTMLLTLLSVFLYGFVYTPLKRVGSIAVLVGAFPGALPVLIGWSAVNSLGLEAFILFGIQFIWQFPHFWAIAWVADEDYKKAGFKLLPHGGNKDLNTAFTIMIYTLLLIPLGLLPTYFGITSVGAAIVATVLGTLFLMQTFYLMKTCSRKAALLIMFGSFLYLPIVQIAYVYFKIGL